jgi:acetate---CoA ligase (ADP-forming)
MLVATMAPPGVELAFGAKRDPSFGPAVMVGAGGVLVGSLTDRAYALVPFDAAETGELIDSLALGARSSPAGEAGGR